jgi:hypothetical protein
LEHGKRKSEKIWVMTSREGGLGFAIKPSLTACHYLNFCTILDSRKKNGISLIENKITVEEKQ